MSVRNFSSGNLYYARRFECDCESETDLKFELRSKSTDGSKPFGGSMYSDPPPRQVPPSAVPLCALEKNPTFSQNLTGSTDKGKIH